jgi:sugar/nucleoside kinase (ribokinase family)
MDFLAPIEPVDYLLIGHVTQDVTPAGFALGGTVSYASLTARAFGKKVGIVTSCKSDLLLPELAGIPVVRKPSQQNSTFENVYTPSGRVQHIRGVAETLTLADIPPVWRNTPIVHLGPVAAEIDPLLAQAFPNSMVSITPQGWLRGWDGNGLISFIKWPQAVGVLKHARVVVLSIEDVQGSEDVIQEYIAEVPVLVVTEGSVGARVYWNGDVRHFCPPREDEIDPVGAGDIFASSFFIRYAATNDPWEAARVATQLAARSVTRRALAGVPTPAEVQSSLSEIIH